VGRFSVRLVFVQAFFVQLHLWLAVHELLSTFPVQEFFWYPPLHKSYVHVTPREAADFGSY